MHPIANICFRSWFSNLFFFLSLDVLKAFSLLRFRLLPALKNFLLEARFYFRPIAYILGPWNFVLIINQITFKTSNNTILNSTTNTQKKNHDLSSLLSAPQTGFVVDRRHPVSEAAPTFESIAHGVLYP